VTDAFRGAEQAIMRQQAAMARVALEDAVVAARLSRCAKSNRGVAVFNPNTGSLHGVGWNEPPHPFKCDGSDRCRSACSAVAVHAEERAVVRAVEEAGSVCGLHLVHVKVINGGPVASGPPSCVECSKMILAHGIAVVWLLHEDGLKPYDAEEFHALSLKAKGLPVIR
jgi:deoxycytidylate deaminase